jgi:hypothetical protein
MDQRAFGLLAVQQWQALPAYCLHTTAAWHVLLDVYIYLFIYE